MKLNGIIPTDNYYLKFTLNAPSKNVSFPTLFILAQSKHESN